MSTVVIVAIGSRGDVAPLTGVGVHLQRAGHRVTVVAYQPFADLITRCGLGFRGLPGELNIDGDGDDVQPIKGLAAFLAPSGMRRLGNDVLAAVDDEPADILLLSPFSELVGHSLAEARGIPSVGLRLQPFSATALYPPAVLGGWSAGAIGNRLTSHAGAWLIDRLYGGVIAGFRRELGLPTKSARILRRQRTQAQWPVLHGYSPLVAPRPADWRPGLDVVGYWWPASTDDWQPPQALADFLAAGPPPVCVGLGSTMVTTSRAEETSDIVRRALRHAGVRGIIQAGWAGLEVVDDDVLTIGEVPHEWLFPRVAAVAHHCGAGTTAAALRTGIPTIALPGLGDQPFWAQRLQFLGTTAATIPQRKLTAERLGAALHTVVTDPELQRTAQHVGSRIDGEGGAERVRETVESLLHQTI